jgi:hypothetical protein
MFVELLITSSAEEITNTIFSIVSITTSCTLSIYLAWIRKVNFKKAFTMAPLANSLSIQGLFCFLDHMIQEGYDTLSNASGFLPTFGAPSPNVDKSLLRLTQIGLICCKSHMLLGLPTLQTRADPATNIQLTEAV